MCYLLCNYLESLDNSVVNDGPFSLEPVPDGFLLPPVVLKLLLPAAVEGLPPAMLDVLPPAVLEVLPPALFELLPPVTFDVLPPAVLGVLPPALFELLVVSKAPSSSTIRCRLDAVLISCFGSSSELSVNPLVPSADAELSDFENLMAFL